MAKYLFEDKKHSFAFIDPVTSKHLKVSFFEMPDRSGYLTINSSNPKNPDYVKISYHPRSNELVYALTNEYWQSQNRPNKERKLFIGKPTNGNQVLAMVYLDRSSAFRTDQIPDEHKKAVFGEDGAVELLLKFEKGRLVLEAKYLPEDAVVKEIIQRNLERIHREYPSTDTPISGCVQALLSGEEMPLRLVVFGV